MSFVPMPTTPRTSAGYRTPSSRSYANQASTGWPFPRHSGGGRHLSVKWSSQWKPSPWSMGAPVGARRSEPAATCSRATCPRQALGTRRRQARVALAAEAVAPQSRAGLVTRITCGLPFGGAICGIVAVNLDWQAIFYVGGLAPLALAPIAAFALLESRAFLEARQPALPTAAARDDFRWILFGGGRASATLLIWTASFASLLALYVLLNWLPTLLGDIGLSKPHASLVSMLFGIGGRGRWSF